MLSTLTRVSILFLAVTLGLSAQQSRSCLEADGQVVGLGASRNDLPIPPPITWQARFYPGAHVHIRQEIPPPSDFVMFQGVPLYRGLTETGKLRLSTPRGDLLGDASDAPSFLPNFRVSEAFFQSFDVLRDADVRAGFDLTLSSLSGPLWTPEGAINFEAFQSGRVRLQGVGSLEAGLPTIGAEIDLRAIRQCNTVRLLDPYPDAMSGSAISISRSVLEGRGRLVKGVAADGVAQIVVSVAAPQNALVTATIESCSTDTPNESNCIQVWNNTEYGGIYSATSPPSASTIFSTSSQALPSFLGLTAVDSDGNGPNPPTALFIYRAPQDYARIGSLDAQSEARTVFLKLSIVPTSGPAPPNFFHPISIVRPPILQVLGGKIDLLESPPQGWTARRLPYSDLPTFAESAARLLSATDAELRQFREDKGIAASQADFVTYSRGGIAARLMATAFKSPSTFGQGHIHKHVTIATPNSGTPLVRLTSQMYVPCKLYILAPWMSDLNLLPGSAFLKSLQVGVPTYAVAATFDTTQSEKWNRIMAILSSTPCSPNSALPPGGMDGFFGEPHDGAVAESSARALGGTAVTPVGGLTISGRAHSTGTGEPDIFGEYVDKHYFNDGQLDIAIRNALEATLYTFGKL